MSSANDYIHAMVGAWVDGDRERFRALALQVIAGHRRAGHHRLADGLERKLGARSADAQVPEKLRGVVEQRGPRLRLDEMVLADGVRAGIEALLREQRALGPLALHGLDPAHRVLMIGPPGCGKTSLAGAVADALGRPLYVVRERVVASHLGETPALVASVFDFAANEPCVLFLDEIDGIAVSRTLDQELQEMRRALFAVMAGIDRASGRTVVLAATNRPERIDDALVRRFDAVWRWPDEPTSLDRASLLAKLEHRHGLTLPRPLTLRLDAGSLADLERDVLARMRTVVLDRAAPPAEGSR